MTSYELTMIGLSAGNRIDVQWGLFLTGHLALVGVLLKLGRQFSTLEKVVALTFYSLLVVQNYRVMRIQFHVMRNAYQDIAAMAGEPCCAGSALVQHIAGDIASGRFTTAGIVLAVGHVLCAGVVFTAILRRRRLRPSESDQVERPA